MAADLLDVEHQLRQVFIINFLPSSLMRDGPVLAKDTAEIAVGEKDSTRSVFAYQRYLFAKMGLGAENHGSDRSPAEPFFTLLPIHPALPGTEVAILEDTIGFFDPLSQFTLLLQFLICWKPSLSLFLFGMKGDWEDEQRTAQEESIFDEIPTSGFHAGTSTSSKARGPFLHDLNRMLT
jgi:hypothetical protein